MPPRKSPVPGATSERNKPTRTPSSLVAPVVEPLTRAVGRLGISSHSWSIDSNSRSPPSPPSPERRLSSGRMLEVPIIPQVRKADSRLGRPSRALARVESKFYDLAMKFYEIPSFIDGQAEERRTDFGALALRRTIELLDMETQGLEDADFVARELEYAIITYLQMQGARIVEMRYTIARRGLPDHVLGWFKTLFSSLRPWLNETRTTLSNSYEIFIHALLMFSQTLNTALLNSVSEATVNTVIGSLKRTFERIRITEGHNDAFDEEQKDEARCATIQLAFYILQYLNQSMALVSPESPAGALEDSDRLASVRGCLLQYNESVGITRATNQGDLARNQKRQLILEWLSPGSSWARHETCRGRRIPGIGQWFIETARFKQWSAGNGHSVLFCHGVPGAGKSFLTSLAIDKLLPLTNSRNHVDIAVVNMYFQFNGQSQQRLEIVVRHLLKQLVFQLDEIPDQLELAYDLSQQDGQEAEDATFVTELKNAFQQFTTVYLFIDGLDRCEEHTQHALCQILQQLSRARLRLFLTIAKNATGNSHIARNKALRELLQGTRPVDIAATPDDIKRYVENQVQKKARNCTQKARIIEAITSAPAEQILLAKLRLIYTISYFERSGDVNYALANLPMTIEEGYTRIMEEIAADGAYTHSLATNVLSWLYHTSHTRLIQIEELRDLLATTSNSTDLDFKARPSMEVILAATHRLVRCDRNSGVVRFTHPTVFDFLEKRHQQYIHPIGYMALTSLTYLSFDVFRSGKSPNIQELRKRMDTYKALRYVAQYWGTFVRLSENWHPVQMMTLAFLSSTPKREAMNQVMDYVRMGRMFDSGRGILHIIAENGLAVNCNLVLYNTSKPGLMYGPTINLGVLTAADFPQDWNVKTSDKYGWTALHMAAFNGHTKIIQILIRAGVRINERDNKGETALHLASSAGQEEVVRLLVQMGANIDAQDNLGNTSLHLAASAGEDEIVLVLLELGASQEVLDRNLRTPLHLAASTGQVNVVGILLKKGAVKDAKDKDGRTPLHLAAFAGQDRVVEELLDANVDAKATDNIGRTAWHLAALRKHDNILRMLQAESAGLAPRTGRSARSTIW